MLKNTGTGFIFIYVSCIIPTYITVLAKVVIMYKFSGFRANKVNVFARGSRERKLVCLLSYQSLKCSETLDLCLRK